MNMDTEIREFERRFLNLKSKGFVASHRTHNTGIGKTFEDFMEIKENNNPLPDFFDLECKSQRALSESYITLTTKSPDYPSGVNSLLRKKYGYPDSFFSNVNILHTSIFHKTYNTCKGVWGFKLNIDQGSRKIHIFIKNLINGKSEDIDIHYLFSTIENIVNIKLQKIAYISADSRRTSKGEEFHFKKVTLLTGLKFDNFIDLIKDNVIMYDIRLGVYQSGKNIGKPHDHGSGLRIKKDSLGKAFNIYEFI